MTALYEAPSIDESVSTKSGTLKNSSFQIKMSPNFLGEHPLKFTLVCSPANSLCTSLCLCFDDYYTTSMSIRTGRYSWRNSQVCRFLLETASVERVNITVNFSLNLILYGDPERRLVPAMVIGGH